MADKLAIKVALKLKSFSNSPSKIEIINQNEVITCGQKFRYNHIFHKNEKPYEIYRSLIQEYMENLLNGEDSAIVIYGPDSLCKTETLGSLFFSDEKFDNRGIIPNFILDIFSRIDEEKVLDQQIDYSVFISLTEIYDGKAYGLFDCDKNCLIKVENLFSAIDLLEKRLPHREDSHIILKLRLEKYLSSKKKFSAEINFVNLAGWKDDTKRYKEIIKVKWDLMLVEEFLLSKLEKKSPVPNGELCHFFNKIVQNNTKILILVCLDPANPCTNSIAFGSYFFNEKHNVDLKFINCDRRKSFVNDETIEW